MTHVYIIDGARTPFLKIGSGPGPWSAADLAVSAAQALLLRNPIAPEEIDEVITGCVMPAPNETNIARVIALRLGCGPSVQGWTVQRNCASGLQALECAAKDIQSGRYHMVLAGGTEAMSRAPWLYSPALVQWLGAWRAQKTLLGRIALLRKLRPHWMVPVIALLQGLSDPIVHLSMGQTAENLVYHFNLSRKALDQYALQSHQRALAAAKVGLFSEIAPLFDGLGTWVDQDTGLRADGNLEKLARLKPVFDRPFGQVTAGNSSQISDGAAFLLLASAEAVAHYQLPVLGRIVDTAWAALDPAMMGLGPVYAIQALLAQQQLSLDDIDYWEINEAFAAQVLGCVQGLATEYAPHPGIPMDRLNVDGGAIAIGHPVGASGARLVLHLLRVLRRTGAKRGIASLCIGGGQGGAMLIEAMDKTL